jgi:hypothetical protein
MCGSQVIAVDSASETQSHACLVSTRYSMTPCHLWRHNTGEALVASQEGTAIALFLGAGFSKPWGMPLAGQVMELDDIKRKMLPGKWQRKLADKVEACWAANRQQYGNAVDTFAQALRHSPLDSLTFDEFARFIALRFSAYHWRVGTAREPSGLRATIFESREPSQDAITSSLVPFGMEHLQGS